MAKYLLKVRYSADGVGGVLKDGGTKRAEVARKLVKSAGGKMISFDFAFGEVDAYIMADFPSPAAVAAAAMTATAGGGAAIETVVLVSPTDIDTAAKAKTSYTKPGE
jgi:uncharacterized protein with GYD domain